MTSSFLQGRRWFGAAMLAGLAAPSAAAALPAARSRRNKLIKAPRLKQGDTVAIIAPGGHISDSGIEQAVANVEALGFKARLSDNVRAKNGNYAGSVRERLDDLHAMFADKEVKALWTVRGGSGCISLLSGINYGLIKANPKILVGYSDITALHLAILKKVGLVTFHGPIASSSNRSPYSMEHMLAVLCDPQAHHVIPIAPENVEKSQLDPLYRAQTVHAGVATGPLMGGNLSLVSALCGTPYAGDFAGSIMFLEEVNEAPYKIDRMLEQLQLNTGLAKAKALMIGICENCGPQDSDPSLTLEETLAIHLDPLTIPAVTGYSFGHIRHQFTLPMGIQARLDTEAQTLTLLEPAVL